MNILTGHTSKETAFEVKDYPYSFKLRTSIFYWIESKDGKGDRLCTQTINPKNGRLNAPKCSTYAPFMYMYLNEENHVKHEAIDAYNLDEFEARFYFILNKIGIFGVTQVQEKNLRVNYYQHVRANAPYIIVKYSEDQKHIYKNWVIGKLNHIKNAPFNELAEYPEPPKQDNPTGEVKMIVTEY